MKERCAQEVDRRTTLLNAIIEKDAKIDPFKTLVQVKGLIHSLESKEKEAKTMLSSGNQPEASLLRSVNEQIRQFPKFSGNFRRDWVNSMSFAGDFPSEVRFDYGYDAKERYMYEDEMFRAENLLNTLRTAESRLLYMLNKEQLKNLRDIEIGDNEPAGIYNSLIADRPYYGSQWEENARNYLNNQGMSWVR